MRGDLAETSVISAGIREAHIEVPVVCRKDMQVGLYQFSAASLETKQIGPSPGVPGTLSATGDRIKFVSERIRRRSSESALDGFHSMGCLLALVNGVSREPDAK